ncbi:MAG TPA: hypothetical protein VG963_24920, partial [Polyangiaceae bacterium]|nr:hypothetical protein [Polyangiaceae bacterium]
FPTLSVEVDGRALIQSQPGLVVVANSRQYAARLDPARSASMTDGLLDVVFYPHRSRVRLGAWGLRTALGVHTRSRSLITAQGKRVHIRCAGQAAPFQLDGECAGRLLAEEPDGDRDQTELRFEVRPGALRVLMPVN